MVLRQFSHGHDVLLDHLRGFGSRVPRNVVGAGQHHHRGGLQLDDIGIHADQHLRRRLAADAAIHVWLARKILLQVPEVGDRIAHEDDAPGRRRLLLQILVGLMITAQLIPVLQLVGERSRGVDETAGRARRIKLVGQLRVCAATCKQHSEGQQ